MPKHSEIKKVVVIGSGPIIIGQAAEFDYAGTQACRSLREEGIEVVLINSNPATIMTDANMADHIYIEPLTLDTVKRIIEIEKPDSILPTLGGQNALNIAMELFECGFLTEQNVKMIGTSPSAIKMAEDRLEFKSTMESIDEPCAKSTVVESVDAAVAFAETIGYPVVVRPAYTLGGTGGGIAADESELREITTNGLRLSRVGQALIEQCISGWKEIEFEVMRDSAGNVITICSMENVDPVGVHTGDSVVVAPAQTLASREFNMLRSSAINIISALGIEGGCNVQYALHPTSFDYCVIEVNPRVSRSSALASKATGYPIAKVASKVALGMTLDEIKNSITGTTYASFEPTIDYVVLKMPKWPFDKFVHARRTLGTQMKATGEVMGISPSFEGALMKALRSMDSGQTLLRLDKYARLSREEIIKALHSVDDERLFVVAEALRQGVSVEEISSITTIDKWFVDKIQSIVEMERSLANSKLDIDLLKRAKIMGFADSGIAELSGKTETEIAEMRRSSGIIAAYKMVDTCAGEFAAQTPYFYSCYGSENEAVPGDRKKVLVLGSGPIRIGQGIEFDYCSVHSLWALRDAGYETIIINNNPETVSTDFDIADKLYFEPLTPEDVENVVRLEKPIGALVQFGGQTAIKLTGALVKMGVPILGTSAENVDRSEDRELFDQVLEKCGVPRPKGSTVFTVEQALEAANALGYPVLVRPSYVLGGAGMEIAFSDEDVREFMEIIGKTDKPILVDKYMMGREVEVDAICDGTDILIPGVMEHCERAGVHSGDSIAVYPTQTVEDRHKKTIVKYTESLARELEIVGLINIQFIIYNDEVYVIEVNPRSSRTIPYVSKITGVPVVALATKAILGGKLANMGYGTGLYPEPDMIAVKMPVFSFEKLYGADISLGPEMKSTGEVLGMADNYPDALLKAFMGAGVNLPNTRKMIVTLRDSDKREFLPMARRFAELGYEMLTTDGTGKALAEVGIVSRNVKRIGECENDILSVIRGGELDLVINTPTRGRAHNRDGYKIRRNAVECGIPCLTSLDTVAALLISLEKTHRDRLGVTKLQDFTKSAD